MSIRYFETANHVSLYSKFRPILPQQVLDFVLKYLSECIDSKEWNIVVDVGCGSGQSTNNLSNFFRRVYGFDVSPEQIREANETKHPNNVYYNISPAESLALIESNSVQLLTACEAAHWFDLEKFFVESKRILVQKGVVALIGYSLLEPFDPLDPNNQTLTELVLQLRKDPVFANYRNENCMSIDKHYADFIFPSDFDYVYKDNFIHTVEAYAHNIVGFIESWSPYQQMLKYNAAEAQKFLLNFEQKLKHLLGVYDLSQKKIMCNFRYFIAMGRKK